MSKTSLQRLSPDRILKLRFLIVAAAVFHVSVAAAVFTAGRTQLAPNQIRPDGLGAFASDGFVYSDEIAQLARVLRNDGVKAWLTWPTQLHLRIYSLFATALGRFGFSIMTIEPINLIYYLGIVVLVFKITEIIFDRRSAFFAAAVVGLWPSFVLHSTQLLRDPLLIVCVLFLLWSVIHSLKKHISWRQGIILGIAGAIAVLTIRIVRAPMFSYMSVIIVAAMVFAILQWATRKRILVGSLIFLAIVEAMVIITPHLQSALWQQQYMKAIRRPTPLDLTIDQAIRERREGFKWRLDGDLNPVPANDGSALDREVKLQNFSDILKQTPRAAEIGFFAPFPSMWFSPGKQVGRAGRYLSGFETLLTYMLECLALVGLWIRRKQLAAWYLMIVMVSGTLAMGLVITNVGALYRLRYPFWMMIVIFAAGGGAHLYRLWHRRLAHAHPKLVGVQEQSELLAVDRAEAEPYLQPQM